MPAAILHWCLSLSIWSQGCKGLEELSVCQRALVDSRTWCEEMALLSLDLGSVSMLCLVPEYACFPSCDGKTWCSVAGTGMKAHRLTEMERDEIRLGGWAWLWNSKGRNYLLGGLCLSTIGSQKEPLQLAQVNDGRSGGGI